MNRKEIDWVYIFIAGAVTPYSVLSIRQLLEKVSRLGDDLQISAPNLREIHPSYTGLGR
jgi:hypothetical protein